MKRFAYIILSAALLSSCVYPFEPKDIKQRDGILVIEGDINVGEESAFVLSRSETLENLSVKVSSFQADDIYVEGEKGTKYDSYILSEEADMNYNGGNKIIHIIDTRNLDPSDRYRLVVKTGGQTYISSWESYLETSPIDSVSYTIQDGLTGIDIHVSTTGTNDSLRYYKWDYIEDWEFTTNYYAVEWFDPDSGNVVKMPSGFNYFYCWQHKRSSSINVLNLSSLAENRVVNHRILQIPAEDNRISYLYAIEVYQKSISKEACVYWETMLKNNDGTGGIFSPQPSEMRGNITCSENPDELVLGYISVCSALKQRKFIYYKDTKVYIRDRSCEVEEVSPDRWWIMYYGHWQVAYRDEMTGQVFWTMPGCVDCRTKGTKNKPDFWPIDDK